MTTNQGEAVGAENLLSRQGKAEAKQRTIAALVVIVVLGVALRVGSALYQGDQVTILPGVFDQVSYHNLAIRVITGHGFSFGSDWWPETRAGQPTAHWSFLYTLYLAGIYQIVGIHPLAARLVQAVVAGILQPLLTWRIGQRIFGSRVGLVAAALSSVYVYFFYYGGALMTETFYILAIFWGFDLLFLLAHAEKTPTIRQPATWLPWLGLGLAFGVAVLLRQVILLLLPFTFGWLLAVRLIRSMKEENRIHVSELKSTAMGLALSVAVVVVLIAPWTVRNYYAFDEFVLLNTNDGYAFFWGNNPIYGTNFVPILPSGEYQRLIPSNLKGLNEAALNDALLRRGIGFVVADPGRYALLSLSRIKSYFEFWPSDSSVFVSNLGRTLSFGVFLPFMIVGLYLSLRGRRAMSRDRWHALVLLYGFMAIYTSIHLLTWALIRYRLPVDAILILFAARSIEPALARLFPSHFRRGSDAKCEGIDAFTAGPSCSTALFPLTPRNERALGKQ